MVQDSPELMLMLSMFNTAVIQYGNQVCCESCQIISCVAMLVRTVSSLTAMSPLKPVDSYVT